MVSRKHFFHSGLGHTSKSIKTHHVYLVAFKIIIFCSNLLETKCLIPKTSPEWTTHSIKEAETWPNHFLERMEEFTKFSKIERDSNKKNSKVTPSIEIDLDNDTCFDS